MDKFIGLPILIGAVMLQVSVISRITLLHGTADLIMVILIAWALQQSVRSAWIWGLIGGLLLSLVSAMPLPIMLLGCLVGVGMARLVYRRIWQAPVIMMLIVTLLSSSINYLFGYLGLWIIGTPLPMNTTISQVILPSLLLNLLIAVPIYSMMNSLAKTIYHIQEEL